MIRSQKAVNGLIVITNEQTAGRGQQGNTWLSEPNANLTFSVIFFPAALSINDSFYLNIISSLAVAQTLQSFLPLQEVKVKWPNDVYVFNKKISGILIENTLRGNQITSTVVGIGINVNQVISDLPHAGSMIQQAGHEFNLQEVLDCICEQLEYYYLLLEQGQKSLLQKLYKEMLFGVNQVLDFSDVKGNFRGIIREVSESGHLLIEKDSGLLQSYAFKEVQFINKI